MKLYHPKHGELSPAGKKYSPIGNKVVPLYADMMGNKHTLDGTEKPMDEMQQNHDQMMTKQADTQKQDKLQGMSDEMDFEKNLQEYDQKEADREEKTRMHTEVVQEVKNASEAIVEAVKAIPETKIPEVKIPDHYAEEKQWQAQVLEVLKKEINLPETNFEPVVKAIQAIKFPSIPEPQDYTKLLQDIKKALPENTDLSGVIEAIKNIPRPKEIPFEFSNGRLKVEVDRVSLAGGSGGAGIATEATLQSMIDPLARYKDAGMDLGSPMYFGYVALDGSWYIKKLDTSSGTTYTKGTTDYDTAWTGRAGLDYDLFNLIFN